MNNKYRLELMREKVGIPLGVSYIKYAKEIEPNLDERSLRKLRDAWNSRSFKDSSNKDNPFWALKLLIKVCHKIKDDIYK